MSCPMHTLIAGAGCDAGTEGGVETFSADPSEGGEITTGDIVATVSSTGIREVLERAYSANASYILFCNR